MKTTGVTSTSFRIWLATHVGVVVGIVQGIRSHDPSVIMAALGLSGVATGVKTIHDQGLNKATIAAGLHDAQPDVPVLSGDLIAIRNFIETEWPASKSLITEATARVTALEAKAAPLVAPVEAVVDAVGAPAPVPPAA